MDFAWLAPLTLLLSYRDLEPLIDMQDAIKVVEEVYREHATGKVVMPAKLTLDLGETGKWPGYDAYLNSMPAYVGGFNIAGVKIVGGFFRNPARGLPSIIGVILLVDPEHGAPLAVMDGTYITAMRTGAATAVGAKYLAKQNAATLGLIGAGVQSRYQLRAIAQQFTPERVLVNDISAVAAEGFAREMSAELGLSVLVTTDKATLCRSDVVVAATTAKEPVILGKWMVPGSLVVPLGSYREIDTDTVKRADKLVVDNLEQATHRGSLAELLAQGILARSDIYAEIGEIVAGTKSGRVNAEEMILFQPIGMGSTDVALAFTAYQRAQEERIGLQFDFM